MNASDKAEITVSIHHTERFSKSGIPNYNSEVQTRLAEKQQQEEHANAVSIYLFGKGNILLWCLHLFSKPS